MEPGPVVLVSTAIKGRANLMTMSWHLMMEFTPPLIGCVVSSDNLSFEALKKTKECVIAIPGADLIEKVVSIGNCDGDEVDKFAGFGLTPLKGDVVKAPLVKECLANLECKVADSTLVSKYNFFVLEVKAAWLGGRKEKRTFHANGNGTFKIDGATRNLKKLMTKWPQFV